MGVSKAQILACFSSVTATTSTDRGAAPHEEQRQLKLVAADASHVVNAMPPPPHALAAHRRHSGADERHLAPRSRRAILFVHIHKAGGTTICAIAKSANLSVPRVRTRDVGFFSKNCNPSSRDAEDALGYRGPDAMVRYAHEHQLDLYGHEWALPALFPWADINVIALVRQPLRLYITLCGVRNPTEKALLAAQRCLLRPWVPNYQVRRYAGCDGNFSFCAGKVGRQDSTFAHGHAMARKLVGYHENAVTNVTVAHFRQAISFLNRAAVVLVTEQLDMSSHILSREFGWPSVPTSQRAGSHSNASDLSLEELEARMPPATLITLRAAAHFDFELHVHATCLCAQLSAHHGNRSGLTGQRARRGHAVTDAGCRSSHRRSQKLKLL